MHFSLTELFDDLPSIQIVDVGASPIDGPPPYQRLIDIGKSHLIGFEPDPNQFQALQKNKSEHATFLPFAVGDGNEAQLNICANPGWTSLLEPDTNLLSHFHHLAEWSQVIRREKLTTHRLDDISDVKSIDYLKLDVQGSELAILKGASEKLSQALVVHTEVLFVPFYKEQPLFAEIDLELRAAGFYLHRFTPLVSRLFKPLVINNNLDAGFSQILWSDAIYVKQFTGFAELSAESLLKIAFLMHDLYGSFDLASVALGHFDQKQGTNRQAIYLDHLTKHKWS